MRWVPYNLRDSLHLDDASEAESEENAHVICNQQEIDGQLSLVDDQLHVAVNVRIRICKEEEVDVRTVLQSPEHHHPDEEEVWGGHKSESNVRNPEHEVDYERYQRHEGIGQRVGLYVSSCDKRTKGGTGEQKQV